MATGGVERYQERLVALAQWVGDDQGDFHLAPASGLPILLDQSLCAVVVYLLTHSAKLLGVYGAHDNRVIQGDLPCGVAAG